MLDTANPDSADSADLIAAAQHDGDPLTRELAERLYLQELENEALRAQLAATKSKPQELLDAHRDTARAQGEAQHLRYALEERDATIARVQAAATQAEALARSLRAQLKIAEDRLAARRAVEAAEAEAACAAADSFRHVEPMSARSIYPGAPPEFPGGEWQWVLCVIDKLTAGHDPDDAAFFAAGLEAV
ncbi:MAG TPA: hypothetical protein VG994_02680 [Steroidobacteraceae bacterium]|nr:hypothetical protein [Steroidobacteraceae bacterium]